MIVVTHPKPHLKRDQTAQVTGSPMEAPPAREVQPAGAAPERQWPGEVSIKPPCFLLSRSAVCLAFAVLSNLILSRALDPCLL